LGDETTQFASRYASALGLLGRLAGDATHAPLRKELGAGLGAAVRGALDAVEAVFESGTEALRRWPERRGRVLAQVAAMRLALDRSGVDEQARRLARTLLETIEPGGRSRTR